MGSTPPPGVAIIDSTYLLEQQRASGLVGCMGSEGLDEGWGSDMLATELESMSLLDHGGFTAASGNLVSTSGGFGLHSSMANILSANASAGGAPDSGPTSKHNSGALLSLDLSGAGAGQAGAPRNLHEQHNAGSVRSLFSIISTQEASGTALHSWAGPSAADSASGQLLGTTQDVHSLSTAEGYLDLPPRLPNRSAPASASISKAHSLVSNTSTSGGHAVLPANRMSLGDNLASSSAHGPRDLLAHAPEASGAGPSSFASPRSAPRGEVAKSQRGQGYRKLWQQVTKVSKGQKLKDAASGQSDVTVEDLVRVVMKLAPQESAVQAVEQGLYYLDSSALAALLKELAKQGHLRRSVEIFDWLRGVDASHELSHLCDLYTYTTMISQCGSHQQLRRALELVAEMRSKGITCNVHTYSALMNVCIKANELELAQDVFDQMIEEGCTPNLVTYNILIDVHVKNGQWEEAVARLDTLERQVQWMGRSRAVGADNSGGGDGGERVLLWECVAAAGLWGV